MLTDLLKEIESGKAEAYETKHALINERFSFPSIAEQWL
jgi:hypothetical protein